MKRREYKIVQNIEMDNFFLMVRQINYEKEIINFYTLYR